MPSGSPIHTPLCDHNVTRHVRAPPVPGPTRRGRAAKHSVAAVCAERRCGVTTPRSLSHPLGPAARSQGQRDGQQVNEPPAPAPASAFQLISVRHKTVSFPTSKNVQTSLTSGAAQRQAPGWAPPQTPVCHSLPAHSSSQEPWTIKANETPKEMEQHDKEQNQ